MTKEQLVQQIQEKSSFLCVGLDPDLQKIPAHLRDLEDPFFAFCKAIIDHTKDYCVAYKPNTAFFEARGAAGWQSLEKTIAYLNETCPNHFIIADAKRGDIGNTATQYARAFFEQMDCDAVTVAPYMGRDSVEPFLAFEKRFCVLLALTSNQGAKDFQTTREEAPLYEEVLTTSQTYAHSERLMYVVGATKAEYLERIRQLVPASFLLIPGVGAQGGKLDEVCAAGMNKEVGLLVNSSRGIIYASSAEDFAQVAGEQARVLQQQMAEELKKQRVFS
ncbi:orotidine-5'-phosphate decarboxylase [Aureicoccus marinus]|jgi:orotidine-5'-phosphate decarboxylase|uniref:Orotidine-5'-phosphate decarboxylase n=1 Tax=Aureicoccus marinus TaxID=754435 RepID=A0A2S7T4S7_9FLAO|nr:orotidine-5'-phosphate decarboxylase [Aureicoccus marinus]PQJ14581.1 orotidine 5'-phosphate decarboxylase [Aureicoccus marinus]